MSDLEHGIHTLSVPIEVNDFLVTGEIHRGRMTYKVMLEFGRRNLDYMLFEVTDARIETSESGEPVLTMTLLPRKEPKPPILSVVGE